MGTRKENSTNRLNEKCLTESCDSIYAFVKIGGRWKMIILYELKNGKLRFTELKKIIPGITERMLTLQLPELENDKLVLRTAYAEAPPRVEYELTEVARELIPIWEELGRWGTKHKKCLKFSQMS